MHLCLRSIKILCGLSTKACVFGMRVISAICSPMSAAENQADTAMSAHVRIAIARPGTGFKHECYTHVRACPRNRPDHNPDMAPYVRGHARRSSESVCFFDIILGNKSGMDIFSLSFFPVGLHVLA